MLLIPCPHCGSRSENEFVYGGDASVRRPAEPSMLSDGEWTRFLYLRDNSKGPHAEYWFHRSGCRRWLRVERDTMSHSVLSASPALRDGGGEG